MLRVGKKSEAAMTRRHWVKFWGQRRMCRPYFITKALGDGDNLLAVTPLNTRPNYYLIRIDSNWNESNMAHEHPMCEHIYEILDAIEDEVGPAEFEGHRGKMVHEGWPCLDDSLGVSWCFCDDLIKEHRLRRVGNPVDTVPEVMLHSVKD